MDELQRAAMEQTARDREATMKPPQPAITLESLHQRLTAIENHPALSIPQIQSETEESNG